MKLNSLLCAGLFTGLLLMLETAQAFPYDSTTIKLEAMFTAPPCDIRAPSEVNLGNVPYGEKNHPPITFTVNCSSTVKSEIYGQLVSGGVLSSDGTTVFSKYGGLVRLSFREQGSSINKITLDGQDLGEGKSSGFCEGATTRTCLLVPSTWVDGSAVYEDHSVLIRFTMRYRA
ncbi:hypothetical protein FDR10_20600 [Salmonella enterica]|nr:hypothetical protein [Salmonella enterica]EEU6243850.1 hypothetical protein [Salmonella enterica]EGH5015781.1 hypothetical protein [Salmonella enterica]EHM5449651.1 hypothetical protein [Salmonella enterica]EHO8997864.1 hypothetical protein [Salmonella enterica]